MKRSIQVLVGSRWSEVKNREEGTHLYIDNRYRIRGVYAGL